MRELLDRTLGQLPEPANLSLETLAFPHWLEDGILNRLITDQEVNAEVGFIAKELGW